MHMKSLTDSETHLNTLACHTYTWNYRHTNAHTHEYTYACMCVHMCAHTAVSQHMYSCAHTLLTHTHEQIYHQSTRSTWMLKVWPMNQCQPADLTAHVITPSAAGCVSTHCFPSHGSLTAKQMPTELSSTAALHLASFWPHLGPVTNSSWTGSLGSSVLDSKGWQPRAGGPNPAYGLFRKSSFIGTRPRTFIHLHIVCGCFHTTVAELSSCHRENMTCKAQNIYYLTLYRKKSVSTHDLYAFSGLLLNIYLYIFNVRSLLLFWQK